MNLHDIFHISYNEAFNMDNTCFLSRRLNLPSGPFTSRLLCHQFDFRIVDIIVSKGFRCPSDVQNELRLSIPSNATSSSVFPAGSTPNTFTASFANRRRIHISHCDASNAGTKSPIRPHAECHTQPKLHVRYHVWPNRLGTPFGENRSTPSYLQIRSFPVSS